VTILGLYGDAKLCLCVYVKSDIIGNGQIDAFVPQAPSVVVASSNPAALSVRSDVDFLVDISFEGLLGEYWPVGKSSDDRSARLLLYLRTFQYLRYVDNTDKYIPGR
jgi:hypothetical protein